MLELSFSKKMFDNSTPNVALNRNEKCDESIYKLSDKNVLILKRLCAQLCMCKVNGALELQARHQRLFIPSSG